MLVPRDRLISEFFSLYMMMGGENKFNISPEEYIFAGNKDNNKNSLQPIISTLALYLDIINILMYVLKFVGAPRSSKA